MLLLKQLWAFLMVVIEILVSVRNANKVQNPVAPNRVKDLIHAYRSKWRHASPRESTVLHDKCENDQPGLPDAADSLHSSDGYRRD